MTLSYPCFHLAITGFELTYVCVADIYSPLKEDETIDATTVNIMYPFEDDNKPPVKSLVHHTWFMYILGDLLRGAGHVYEDTWLILWQAVRCQSSVYFASEVYVLKLTWTSCFLQLVTEYDWQFDEFQVWSLTSSKHDLLIALHCHASILPL